MEYRINENENEREIMMEGSFGFEDNSVVELLVESLGAGHGGNVVLNLSRLEKIDSAGLGMIVLIKDEVAATGGSFVVRGAAGQVQKMLDVSRFSQLMTVQP